MRKTGDGDAVAGRLERQEPHHKLPRRKDRVLGDIGPVRIFAAGEDPPVMGLGGKALNIAT